MSRSLRSVWPLALLALAVCTWAGDEGVVASNGLALNEHFALNAWFSGPVDSACGAEGALVMDNITRVPVGLSMGYIEFCGSFDAWMIDSKAGPGLWGKISPGDGKPLSVASVIASAVYTHLIFGNYRIFLPLDEAMNKRTIVLLPGEGYARHFVMPPAFFADQRFVSLRAFRLGTGSQFNEHFLAKDARVEPGKPVPLLPGRLACAGGYQDVELVHGAAPAAKVEPVRLAGTPLRVLAYARLSEGDLEIRYALMNDAQGVDTDDSRAVIAATMWLWQNDCTPAGATAEVRDGERVLAATDNTAAAVLAGLMPSRDPLLMQWGEALTWRLVIPAAALKPLRKGRTYSLSVQVPCRVAGGQALPATPPEPTRVAIAIPLRW